jgi:DUF4097 and DUF4098 domain-containing protein YvlB
MRVISLSPLRFAAWVLPVVLLLSAGAICAARQQPAEESFDRTVPLPSGGAFSISNVNGSIEIEGWNRDEVRISARKITSGPPESLGQVGITLNVARDSVSVATHYPEGSGVEVNVEFRVRVPARVRLASVTTVNGSVTVHDVSGAGLLSTVNGNVTLARGAGLFSARATNGNIALELLSLAGGLDSVRRSGRRVSLSAQTVNGSVVLALPSETGAELEARTQNGDFSSELPLLAHTSAAGRVIRGRVGDGGPLLELRTVNGAIRLRIARPLV